ncbi:phage integrase family protein [Formosa agariphila KMM 3901]|uniref:Phage integrase family protein n=1 Tax=Formosa agariphila (strain DSM 15362 / KCTC 12365 / LMG 23005 / KMM 3901 / M-2Alg 35-1) TaxID=1347342 RepID=T2KN99_FORAG|nr:site-specific integrase [Formosa agariphila]CDF79943.1 phage integrase family protein [Formosa agariphila KMM 3901]
MKTSTTFSILFWADFSRAKKDHASIYARITVNGKRATISLKRKVFITDWDIHKNRARGTNQKSRMLNSYLDETFNHLFKCYRDLMAEQKLITSQAIKARYFGQDDTSHSIMDIVNYHNEDMVNKLKWGTQKNYFTTQKYISKFLVKSYKTTDLYLRELDYHFIIKFEKYLRGYMPVDHQKPMGNNTVMKHIERFRKLINLSFKLGWIDRDPFVSFKSKFIKNDRGFLSHEELQVIENKIFSIPRLDLVKDLFVFACYTSLSYIDMINLTADNIAIGIDGELWIYYRREKTTKPIRIPLLPKALQIIEKYKSNYKSIAYGTVFPKISNQKLNAYLKEIADVCGIYKNLTFHIARHTFATTITLSNGTPIETVSKILGHSRISTTQIYAKVIERKVSDDMHKLRVQFKEEETK